MGYDTKSEIEPISRRFSEHNWRGFKLYGGDYYLTTRLRSDLQAGLSIETPGIFCMPWFP